MGIFGGAPSYHPPPPPPPPANPPQMANASVQNVGAAQRAAAAAGSGAGFADTIKSGPMGVQNVPTAQKALLGQ